MPVVGCQDHSRPYFKFRTFLIRTFLALSFLIRAFLETGTNLDFSRDLVQGLHHLLSVLLRLSESNVELLLAHFLPVQCPGKIVENSIEKDIFRTLDNFINLTVR